MTDDCIKPVSTDEPMAGSEYVLYTPFLQAFVISDDESVKVILPVLITTDDFVTVT